MSDEPKDETPSGNVTVFPAKRTRRKREQEPVAAAPTTQVIPSATLPEGLPPEMRAQVSAYVQRAILEVRTDLERQIEIIRNEVVHPSPIVSKFVRQSAALGLAKRRIASMCSISQKALQQFYLDDIEIGEAIFLSEVAANGQRIALSHYDPNNAKMIQFFLDRRGDDGYAPRAQKVEIDDKRKEKENVIDSTQLTYEERQQLRAMIERKQAGGEGEPLQPGEEELPMIE